MRNWSVVTVNGANQQDVRQEKLACGAVGPIGGMRSYRRPNHWLSRDFGWRAARLTAVLLVFGATIGVPEGIAGDSFTLARSGFATAAGVSADQGGTIRLLASAGQANSTRTRASADCVRVADGYWGDASNVACVVAVGLGLFGALLLAAVGMARVARRRRWLADLNLFAKRAAAQVAALFLALLATDAAAAPATLNYQGQLLLNEQVPTGAAFFKFALIDAAQNTVLWSNDGASPEPVKAMRLDLSDGHFFVELGAGTHSDNSAVVPLPVGALAGKDLRLRVWVSGSESGPFSQLTPDPPFGAVPYAFDAQTLQGKAPASFAETTHQHSAADITSGTLASARLGAGSITSDKIADGSVATADLSPTLSITTSGTISAATLNATDLQLGGSAVTASASELNQALDGIGAGVTAANLTNLTGGASADSLHAHTTAAGWTHAGTGVSLVTASDSVGIGTQTPGTKLDVVGGAIRTNSQFITTVPTGTAPLVVSSTTKVTNLNADTLDGQDSSAFATSNHTHSVLTAGAGLGGGTYNGSSAVTLSVAYGTAANTAVQGNQTATVTAGNGLSGGVSADALGNGFSATLNVGAGSGITAGADTVSLGPLTADWSQTGAFDMVLNNAASELRILESAGGINYGTFDVGDLSANQTYTFTTGGTVWSSGNDGAGSTLDADRLDGLDSAALWQRAGNAGTTPGTDFLGTTDNKALEFKVNGQRALRLEPTTGAANVLAGLNTNAMASGVIGGTIAGGGNVGTPNLVYDNLGTVGGGGNNQAGSNDADVTNSGSATVAGGLGNVASGARSAVGGGRFNLASGFASVVAGGEQNWAAGTHSAVCGGFANVAGGDYSVVAGGRGSTTNVQDTFAAGRRASADDQGAFVWADSNEFDFLSTGPNKFDIRATGGVRFVSAINPSDGSATSGVRLNPGANAWSTLSDRNAKHNFEDVDVREIASRVAALPIQTWNYKAESAEVRHMGPMAQDFWSAFAIGEDDTHITTIDADGVALAAIQGLYLLVQDRDHQIADLKAQNGALERRLAALEAKADTVLSSSKSP